MGLDCQRNNDVKNSKNDEKNEQKVDLVNRYSKRDED